MAIDFDLTLANADSNMRFASLLEKLCAPPLPSMPTASWIHSRRSAP